MQVFSRKSEGKKFLRRSKHRWNNIIGTDIEEIQNKWSVGRIWLRMRSNGALFKYGAELTVLIKCL
jgi:hypothetical protein